ncbi:BatA domain-containing protein [Mucilaginibacter sp. 21P]|uniref:BatA domain-containing protein n=1 Tax=Mucilaginibacter sp. 21P TaxID=2778902 RepID=UPI001C581533|nr:BatA domain-containing protein [Mucilaginibacter sp. 21P]QXV66543.1 BatA domain-containing protein [Mucilaginibacter sp. 21P]
MQFLSPIWFISLAALSIPLVIHLWNIRPGKTLRIGSISLISEASKASSRSLKLLEILLLILRCLLLALITAFLAKPVWEKINSASKAKGWVLIPKENFKETYFRFKPQVDSLVSKGYEFHYFSKGFEKRDSTKQQVDTDSNTNYWSLIKQLERIGQGRQVYIFSPNFKKHFKGSKPSVSINLKWQTYTPADSVSRWIVSAAFTNDGSIKVTDGTSTPSGTSYINILLKGNGDAVHAVLTQNGRTTVSFKNSKEEPMLVDTATQRIAIYNDKYPLDAQYLKAALDAATAFHGTKTTIKQYSNTIIPNKKTWLFWLSEKPVPAALANNAKHIFAYADGKPIEVNSWIEPGHIALNKRVAASKIQQLIWTDGFGDAILSHSPLRGQGGFYRFYTHFNPAWNNLVWSDDFPAMMLKLLYPETDSQPNSHDRRILTDQHIQPEVVKAASHTSPYRVSEQKDVSRYFWLLLMLIFAAERVLNFKLKQQENG